MPHNCLDFHNFAFCREKVNEVRKERKIKQKLSFSSASCLMCCSQKGEQRCCSAANLPRGICLDSLFLVACMLYEYFLIENLN